MDSRIINTMSLLPLLAVRLQFGNNCSQAATIQGHNPTSGTVEQPFPKEILSNGGRGDALVRIPA